MKYIGKLKTYSKETVEKLKLCGFKFPYEFRTDSDDLKRYFVTENNSAYDDNKDLIEFCHFEPDLNLNSITLSDSDQIPDLSQYQNNLEYVNYLKWRDDARGNGIQIVDLETSWNLFHEDIIQNNGGIIYGSISNDINKEQHGTAVLGILTGKNNNIGTIGLCPESTIFMSSCEYFTLEAILAAYDKLNKGDVLLIEVGISGYPLEYYDAYFDAIKHCTDKGIIVVEPAANGGANLDDPQFNGKFDRSIRDSGAILVAGAYVKLPYIGPTGSTGYGNRIDICAPATNIVTCGFGDFVSCPNKNKWYTNSFDGTSSAASQIAGICASLNSARKLQNRELYDSFQMRRLLTSTGIDTDKTRFPDINIGKFVNFKEAIKYVAPLPDCNLDGICDLDDFFIFADYYSNRDLRADLNADGIIDLSDYWEFIKNYGKSYI